MKRLIEQVAALFGLTISDLESDSRRRDIAQARQAAAWVLRRAYPLLSLEAIGEQLGHRDHTTVIYSIQRVEERMRTEPALAAELRALLSDTPPTPQRARRQRIDAAMRWWANQSREASLVLAA